MAEMKDISRCRYCSEEIGWLKTKGGKNIALDWNKLTRKERISIREGLTVEYDSNDDAHKNGLHLLTCPAQVKTPEGRELQILQSIKDGNKIAIKPDFYLSDGSTIIKKTLGAMEENDQHKYMVQQKYESYLRILLRYLKRGFMNLIFEKHFEGELDTIYLTKLWIFTDEEMKELILDLNQILEESKNL